MTDNEIKKALGCCWIKGLCNGCPLDKDAGGTPCKQLGSNALDLINRQQAEIKVKNKLLDIAEAKFEKIRAEAIKEFAERAKESAAGGWFKSIDEIAEEMVGEAK